MANQAAAISPRPARRRGRKSTSKTALADFLVRLGVVQEEGARRMQAAGIKITLSHLSKLCAGSTLPSPKMADAIVAWSAVEAKQAGIRALAFAELFGR